MSSTNTYKNIHSQKICCAGKGHHKPDYSVCSLSLEPIEIVVAAIQQIFLNNGVRSLVGIVFSFIMQVAGLDLIPCGANIAGEFLEN